MKKQTDEEWGRAGLCGNCQHMRLVTSDRGARFYLCQLSALDKKYPKYPRLPVIQCRGYEREETNS